MPNMAMAQLLLDKMREVGAPRWTPEDRTFARALFSQIPQRYLDETCSSFGLGEGDLTDGLVNGIYDGYYRSGSLGASTDLGDVSCLHSSGLPRAQLVLYCGLWRRPRGQRGAGGGKSPGPRRL